MIQGSFPAMGTTIEVVAEDPAGLEATQALFVELEQRLSRFLPDSELSVVNRAADPVVELSPVLAQVLEVASQLRSDTAGLVDPAVGAAVKAWGYDTTFSEATDRSEMPDSAEVAPWSIAGTQLTREPGTQIDLGGIAKGWAADQAVESAMALVVSAGGDVRSSLAGARVELRDPWDGTPASVVIGKGALATSSVARRRWRVGAQEAHHLIDPRTGGPARTPILAATAMCESAVASEAAAKAVLLHGVDGLAWASDQPWIGAAMAVWHDGSVFATVGWEVAA